MSNELLARPYIVTLMYRKTCNFIFWVSVRQEFPEFSNLAEMIFRQCPPVYNKREDVTICWPGHPVLR